MQGRRAIFDLKGFIMKRLSWSKLSFLSALAITCGGVASAQTVQVSVGAEYSKGSYGGTADTVIYETPITLRYRAGDWSFRARVPFASIDGPGGVVPGGLDDNGGDRSGPGGGDDVILLNPLGEVLGGVHAEGLADISLSATWTHDLGSDSYLDLTGRVTLPTGDAEKNLGSGETDFAVAAETGHDFGGVSLYAFAGYKFRGGDTREDGAQFGGGGYTRLGEGIIAGVDAGWSESSLNSVDESAELTGYASFGLSKDLRLSVFALTGLTDNAPDFGGGVTLTWNADFRRPTE